MINPNGTHSPDETTQSCRIVLGMTLKRLRTTYANASDYTRQNAGPAMRGAISALELWADNCRPGSRDDDCVAGALCDAACEIESRNGWTFLSDSPWPFWRDEVRRLYRSAERLCPMILAPDQCTAAGLDPDRG